MQVRGREVEENMGRIEEENEGMRQELEKKKVEVEMLGRDVERGREQEGKQRERVKALEGEVLELEKGNLKL